MAVTSLLAGIAAGYLLGNLVIKKKKGKEFVCGHCESKNTLSMQKLGERDVFTCSFCERIVDEQLLKIQYKEDYELIKKDPEKYEELKQSRLENKNVS